MYGFFASSIGKDEIKRRVSVFHQQKNLSLIKNNFLEFQINVMICYLLHKRNDLNSNKSDKIDMFLFAIFSLLEGKNMVQPKDEDDSNAISLSNFYTNRIFNRIKQKEESIEKILENSHKIIGSEGREKQIVFLYDNIIDSIIKLISENLILLNPLKALYKFVFSKVNVIMRISDVQCAKKKPYKPRLINKMLVSHSGDSLIFSNIETEQIKIIEEKNGISSQNKSSIKTFQFDFMNHIYGPNDTNKMMTDRINYGFFNLLKSYDNINLRGDMWANSILSSVYFTYGFSGSGKTYNTKMIISKLLMYIAENHDLIKTIDIRYSELVSKTTPDEDVLMSGKEFNGPISNHIAWKEIEEDVKPGEKEWLSNYKKEILPYFYTKDNENTQPLVIQKDLHKFIKDTENSFEGIKSILDDFVEGGDAENRTKEVAYGAKQDYQKEMVIYDKNGKVHTLTLCFNDSLHNKYWFEKFYGISKKLETNGNEEKKALYEWNYETKDEIDITGYSPHTDWDLSKTLSEANKFNDIPNDESLTSCTDFNKINLGDDFDSNTLLNINYLPLSEWVLINGHIPMKTQTYTDIYSILTSKDGSTWNTNKTLLEKKGGEKVDDDRRNFCDKIFNQATNVNNLNNVDAYSQNFLSEEKLNDVGSKGDAIRFYDLFVKAHKNINSVFNSQFEKKGGVDINVSGISDVKIYPIHFLTQEDDNKIEFNYKFSCNIWTDENINFQITKKMSEENFQINLIEDELSAINCINKAAPELQGLANGYSQVKQKYIAAKRAITEILGGNVNTDDSDIIKKIESLKQFPFTSNNFKLDGDLRTEPIGGDNTYIEFKFIQNNDKMTEKMAKAASSANPPQNVPFLLVPYKIVFNGKKLETEEGGSGVIKAITADNAYLSKFYTGSLKRGKNYQT